MKVTSGVDPKLKWPERSFEFVMPARSLREKVRGHFDGDVWSNGQDGVGDGRHRAQREQHDLKRAVSASGFALWLNNRSDDWQPRRLLLEVFLRIFHKSYLQYQKEGFEPFRRIYWQNYFAPGEAVHLARPRPAQCAGIARGVDGSGAIMIEYLGRKIHVISEGEISHLKLGSTVIDLIKAIRLFCGLDRLTHWLGDENKVQILAKAEFCNPGGSVKGPCGLEHD